MRAEITYNAGKSCQLMGRTFKQGVTKTVSNAELIRYCQNTHGFAVHVTQAKVVRPVDKPSKEKAGKSKVKGTRDE